MTRLRKILKPAKPGTIHGNRIKAIVRKVCGIEPPQVHVMASIFGGWAVRKKGAKRSLRIVSTKSQAKRIAKQIAKKAMGKVYVHDRDGRVQVVIDFSR